MASVEVVGQPETDLTPHPSQRGKSHAFTPSRLIKKSGRSLRRQGAIRRKKKGPGLEYRFHCYRNETLPKQDSLPKLANVDS